MPTYDYVCTACGHEFEVFQKMSDPPKKRCPECRSKVERKIGTGAGLIFKGSGFYITDYRSDDYKKKQQSENAGGSGKSSEKSAGSESAPKKESKSPGTKKAKKD